MWAGSGWTGDPQQGLHGASILWPTPLMPTTTCEHIQWPDPACSLRSQEPTVVRKDQPSLHRRRGGVDGTQRGKLKPSSTSWCNGIDFSFQGRSLLWGTFELWPQKEKKPLMPRPGAGGSWQEPPIASAEGPGRGDSPGVLGKGEVSVGATESVGTQVMGSGIGSSWRKEKE